MEFKVGDVVRVNFKRSPRNGQVFTVAKVTRNYAGGRHVAWADTLQSWGSYFDNLLPENEDMTFDV